MSSVSVTRTRRPWLPIALMVLFLAYSLFPVWWLLVSSTKSLSDLYQTFGLSFAHWNLGSNVSQTLDYQNHIYLRWVWNSVVYSTLGAAGCTLISIAAGYGIAKFNFRGRGALFAVTIGCSLLPGALLALPLYLLFSKIGLLNTYASLIVPYAVSALGTFLIRDAFLQVSDDIVDAARVDGAGTFTIIFRVMAPIARPTLVAFSLFSVVYHWNDFFWPLVMTTSEAVRTLPIGVAMLREEGTGDRWHVIMAGSMFVVAPVLAVFIVAQRHIIRAFTFTSLK